MVRLLLALGLSVALFSATLIAFDRSTSSAQQAPDTTVASTDTSQSSDTTAATDTTDTTASSDTTDTTGADATTTTALAGNGDDGNINNLPLHDGTQKGGVFNPVPYGEIPANTPQVVIQRIPSNGQLDTECDSFVVLEQEGTTNVISGVGPPITVAGRYRVCVDDASGAHYVAVRAFAQQGGPVDCVRVLSCGCAPAAEALWSAGHASAVRAIAASCHCRQCGHSTDA